MIHCINSTRRGQVAKLNRRGIATFAALCLAALGLSCSSNDDTSSPVDEPATEAIAPETTPAPSIDLPDVAVTYSVLASVVGDLVDGIANVVTIIPDGQDPHDFEPSAKDIEVLNNAAFVVANGAGFEEGLQRILDTRTATDGSVFLVADHITLRAMTKDDLHDDGHSHDHDEDVHDHGGIDPHLWLSPAAMIEMLPSLSSQLGKVLGVDLAGNSAQVAAGLTSLDVELQGIMTAVARCELVTGHDELGYFADRYGCETIGAVVPSSTTTSEASAKQLAALKRLIKLRGATVIFVSLGTPKAVAEQIGKETGAVLVELSTHVMGNAESYDEFMRALATAIAEALA